MGQVILLDSTPHQPSCQAEILVRFVIIYIFMHPKTLCSWYLCHGTLLQVLTAAGLDDGGTAAGSGVLATGGSSYFSAVQHLMSRSLSSVCRYFLPSPQIAEQSQIQS